MNVTRRNFLEGAASVGALLAVAGCSGAGVTDAESSAPAAESYPLDPDGDGVKAKYTTEIVGDVRTGNGWTKVTNEDGAVLGLMRRPFVWGARTCTGTCLFPFDQ